MPEGNLEKFSAQLKTLKQSKKEANPLTDDVELYCSLLLNKTYEASKSDIERLHNPLIFEYI